LSKVSTTFKIVSFNMTNVFKSHEDVLEVNYQGNLPGGKTRAVANPTVLKKQK